MHCCEVCRVILIQQWPPPSSYSRRFRDLRDRAPLPHQISASSCPPSTLLCLTLHHGSRRFHQCHPRCCGLWSIRCKVPSCTDHRELHHWDASPSSTPLLSMHDAQHAMDQLHMSSVLHVFLVPRAAGFIATELVSQLLSKGYEVRGTVRDPNNQAKVAHLVQLGQVRSSACICFRKARLCAQHPSSCQLLL